MTKTVTARVPDDLKDESDEYDINVSELIRDALESEVKRCRREKLLERGDELGARIGDELDTERTVENIRQDRESESR